MRLFFAIDLPREVQAALGSLRPPDNLAWARDYRWVEPSLMHVTLAFLGEQPPDRLDQLKEIGAATAAGCKPGDVSLGGAGSFGPPRAPRVLWVGLLGNLGHLREVQTRLADALRTAGFGIEDRAFSPHITLARRRAQARPGTPPAWPPVPPPGPFHAPM